MARLPLIVGFGGINAAGRSSFHHGYRRMIFDALDNSTANRTLRSLAALMQLPIDDVIGTEARQFILDHTLIRRIEADWFDPQRAPLNRRLPIEAGAQPLSLVTKARNLPEERVRQLVGEHTTGRLAGLLGEPRVNVLALNMALDAAATR